ncbi:MAG: hypothetical protein NWP79_07155, partial [Paracoccaceae bacterium]|nr:hypothetical protein [Paracoccaceae bacterium]
MARLTFHISSRSFHFGMLIPNYILILASSVGKNQLEKCSMPLEDLHNDASAVFDHASFAMGTTWFGSDLEALTTTLRATPAQGILLFLTGSRQRGQDAQFARWMADLPGWLMVAPNTHALSARPSYTSPAEQSVYAQVHH